MRHTIRAIFFLLLFAALVNGQPYFDPSLPVEQRVDDLLARMTLAEKIGQMTQAERNSLLPTSDITTLFLGSVLSGGGSAPADNGPSGWANLYDQFQALALKTRLSIPLIYGIDAVHGHNNVKGAVIFPHNIGLGCTRDSALVAEAARITSLEVAGTGIDWTFAPCIAVPRDERWGRTYEGFAETPELTRTMAAAATLGFQGDSLGQPGHILACAKHYLADGGTTGGDDQGNAEMDEATLRAIHLPGYIAAIAAGAGSVMASYSSWNGVKMHGNYYLLTTVLKEELGFDGFVVSDFAGIDQLPGDYASDVEQSVNAGIDMVMVPDKYREFITTLTNLVNTGKVSMARIDDAARRILRIKFRLGLFENFYTDRTLTAQIGSAAHRDVARQCVRKSLVLLQKKDGVLPLSRSAVRIHVAGNCADNLGYQCGGWTISWQGGNGAITTGTTILQALRAAAPGVDITYSADGSGSAGADFGVAVIGETPYAEGTGDKTDLSLPAAVVAPVRAMKNAGLPVAVILISGRPMIINNILPWCDAIIAAWLPGSEGEGVADVLFGDYPPAGRLSHSWPAAMWQIPINVGDGLAPLFPYGHGLETLADPVPGTAPVFYAASSDETGDRLYVHFNKKMAAPETGSEADWRVKLNGTAVNTSQITVGDPDSTTLIITIQQAINKRDNITLDYLGNRQRSFDGGALAPFEDRPVYNLLDETVTLHTLPCRIQAEDYSAMLGIQTEATTDAGGGLDVGWIDTGDYLDYSLAVPTGGAYRVDLRVAAASAAGQIKLMNGSTALATIDLPVTGGWQAWQTVSAQFNLPRARFTLRLLASRGGFNINYMDFIAVTGVEEEPAAPSGLLLSANYPNPFNAGTAIDYQLPRRCRVKLSAFDIRGALSHVLVDEWQEKGEHQLRLDATGLASGVYLLHLEAGGEVRTIKASIVK